MSVFLRDAMKAKTKIYCIFAIYPIFILRQHLIHNFLDTSLLWYRQELSSATVSLEGTDPLAFFLITFF